MSLTMINKDLAWMVVTGKQGTQATRTGLPERFDEFLFNDLQVCPIKWTACNARQLVSYTRFNR